MTPEEKQQLQSLQNKVNELEKQIKDLSNPATMSDEFVRALITKGFLKANLKIDYVSASNNNFRNIFTDFFNTNVVLTGVDRAYYVKFTASTSDTCTADGKAPENDTSVYVISTGTLPAPLIETTQYYIINSSGNTFKLSTTVGGAAVNITDVGAGAHYLHIQ